MRYLALLSAFLWSMSHGVARANDTTLNKGMAYSLNVGSFVYHAYAPSRTFTQYFDNMPIVIERRMEVLMFDAIVVGTLINSEGNRCFLLGLHKNWHQFSRRLTFEGVYAYAGEFFINPFHDCGKHGIYHAFQNATGIGFAPYIYHGFEYDINSYASLEAGVILPGIIVLSVQWHF